MKTLSDKIKDLSVYMDWGNEPTYDMDDDKNGNWLSVSDVKQFIKEIKLEIMRKYSLNIKRITPLQIKNIIGNLAGKELIE